MAVSEPRVDQLTASQRDALAAELAELEGPSRQAVVQAIKTAREHGDLSENFEYHAAKNEQGLLEARIRTLRFRLENSVLVDESMLNAGEVGVGSRVEIEDGPWPAFPADLTSIAVTVATQAFGTVLIFEKMFESRLFFTDKLVSMGARIILCDPHRVVVSGPTPLFGQRMESPDIRAGMSMLLASLCAEGQSTIGAVYQIDKGYERIDERLRALGAHIERVST